MSDGHTLFFAFILLLLGLLVSFRSKSATRHAGIQRGWKGIPHAGGNGEAPGPTMMACLQCGGKLRVPYPYLSNIKKCPWCGYKFIVVLWDSDNTLYMSGLEEPEEGHPNDLPAASLAGCLEVLGMSAKKDIGTISVSEIRKQYYRTIQQYHPDKYAGAPPEFRAVAEKKTRELNEAYACLIRHKTQ